MILFLFLILFLVVENLVLPALIGPKIFFIVPLFISGIIVYSQNIKRKLIHAGLFLLVTEIFLGHNIGDLLLPFSVTALIYLWLNRFLSLESGLQENDSFGSIIGGSLVIATIFYVFSFFFILAESSYSITHTWAEWIILLPASSFSVLGWSLALTILFKYVLKTK